LGLVGSFHCAGMCGPIACALPLSRTDKARLMLESVYFHLTRVLTYALLGLVLGLLGTGLFILNIQKYMLLLMGAVFIFIGLSNILPFFQFKNLLSGFSLPGILKDAWARAFRNNGILSVMTLGFLNGLIPCGLVYAALGIALFAGSLTEAALYMTFFGAGTLPMMITLTSGVSLGRSRWKHKIRKIYPFMFLFIGALMLMRALQIEIPLNLDLWESFQNPVMCH
jgi:uncharacterized protein